MGKVGGEKPTRSAWANRVTCEGEKLLDGLPDMSRGREGIKGDKS